MITYRTSDRLRAEHGVVCDLHDDFFGYFGWPSVARGDDGTLYAAASGLRSRHVGPFGRNVLLSSTDDGRTWTSPRVVNDSPLDDRDTGIIAFPGSHRLLISWFSPDIRRYANMRQLEFGDDSDSFEAGFRWISEETVAACFGSWVKVSEDRGITWSHPSRSPLTAPHGPVLLSDGSLLYFGKVFAADPDEFGVGTGAIAAARSDDYGSTWTRLGTVPLIEGTSEHNYHEPHIVELADGRLLGLIRVQSRAPDHLLESVGIPSFSLAQTESSDGGQTFTRAESLGFHGSPPHLIRHSSGAVIAVYGRREEPYGQRAAITRDGGLSWKYDYVLRDDGPDPDLGYPASVELADGRVLTVYYQRIEGGAKRCSLLYSRWRIPD